MPKFEIRREPVDATYGGMFGNKADTNKHFIAGLIEYFIDDTPVTKNEYEQAVKDWETRALSGWTDDAL